jgi:hypothetical protein
VTAPALVRLELEETPQWHVGQWAEATVAKWARRNGFATLDLSALRGRNRVVLPDGSTRPMADLGLLGGRGLEAVEVKWKECPVLYQVARQFRHGVDLPHWDAYLHIQERYSVPVGIWVVEWRPGAAAEPRPVLLRALVDVLKPHVQRAPTPTKKAPRGMAYWDREVMLDVVALPGAIGHPPLHLPRLVHPWERKSRDGHAPHAGDGVSEKPRAEAPAAESRQLSLFGGAA